MMKVQGLSENNISCSWPLNLSLMKNKIKLLYNVRATQKKGKFKFKDQFVQCYTPPVQFSSVRGLIEYLFQLNFTPRWFPRKANLIYGTLDLISPDGLGYFYSFPALLTHLGCSVISTNNSTVYNDINMLLVTLYLYTFAAMMNIYLNKWSFVKSKSQRTFLILKISLLPFFLIVPFFYYSYCPSSSPYKYLSDSVYFYFVLSLPLFTFLYISFTSLPRQLNYLSFLLFTMPFYLSMDFCLNVILFVI